MKILTAGQVTAVRDNEVVVFVNLQWGNNDDC